MDAYVHTSAAGESPAPSATSSSGASTTGVSIVDTGSAPATPPATPQPLPPPHLELVTEPGTNASNSLSTRLVPGPVTRRRVSLTCLAIALIAAACVAGAVFAVHESLQDDAVASMGYKPGQVLAYNATTTVCMQAHSAGQDFSNTCSNATAWFTANVLTVHTNKTVELAIAVSRVVRHQAHGDQVSYDAATHNMSIAPFLLVVAADNTIMSFKGDGKTSVHLVNLVRAAVRTITPTLTRDAYVAPHVRMGRRLLASAGILDASAGTAVAEHDGNGVVLPRRSYNTGAATTPALAAGDDKAKAGTVEQGITLDAQWRHRMGATSDDYLEWQSETDADIDATSTTLLAHGVVTAATVRTVVATGRQQAAWERAQGGSGRRLGTDTDAAAHHAALSDILVTSEESVNLEGAWIGVDPDLFNAVATDTEQGGIVDLGLEAESEPGEAGSGALEPETDPIPGAVVTELGADGTPLDPEAVRGRNLCQRAPATQRPGVSTYNGWTYCEAAAQFLKTDIANQELSLSAKASVGLCQDDVPGVDLVLQRVEATETSIRGRLLKGGKVLFDTIELPFRDNKVDVSAILPGTYSYKKVFWEDHKYDVLRLEDKNNRKGILVHGGGSVHFLKGCINVGKLGSANAQTGSIDGRGGKYVKPLLAMLPNSKGKIDVQECYGAHKVKGTNLLPSSRLDIKLGGRVVQSVGNRRLKQAASTGVRNRHMTSMATNGTRSLADHVTAVATSRYDRHLGRIREDRTIFSGCIVVIFGIRLCLTLGMWWSHGTDVGISGGTVSASIGASAGVYAEAAINVWIGEVGIYADGTLLDANLALRGSFKNNRVCMDLGASMGGVRWEQGLYYRVIECGCHWCCYCRCSMSGRRFIGSPSSVNTRGAQYSLWDTC